MDVPTFPWNKMPLILYSLIDFGMYARFGQSIPKPGTLCRL